MKSKYFGEKIQNDSQRWNSIFILLVVIVSFGVYANALFNDFVYDDILLILENPWIKNVKYLTDIFLKDAWGFENTAGGSHYYRPLMNLFYMATYYVFGLRPLGFHLVNILFHAGISVLVFCITFFLLRGRQPTNSSYLLPSFAGALIFATHPIHTEAVTWVAGITDLSFTLFSLLSFFFYLKSGEERPLIGKYIFSLTFFLLAILCKETALVVPLIIIAYDFVLKRNLLISQVKMYLPYFVIGIGYVLWRFSLFGGFAPIRQHSELTHYGYAINVLPLFVQYLEKLLVPINLNAFHVFHPITSIFDMRGVISLALSLVFIAFALVIFKKDKIAFLSLCLISIPLIPALYIPALGENTFAERYLYFPSFGFVLFVASMVNWLVEKRRAVTFVIPFLVVLLGFYSLNTVFRNAVWKNEYRLMEDTVKKSPDAAFPRNNLGKVYNEMGMTDKAIEQFQTALVLKPRFAGAHNNLGVAYNKKGLVDEAIEQFRIAISLKPLSGTYVNLGVAYSNKGLIDEAIKQYQIAIKLKPENVDAYVNLGIAYGEKGFIDQAIEYLEAAIRLNPEDPHAHHNLANAYRIKGLFGKAHEHLQKAKNLQRR